ncbi:MAG TPA: hypothetical protein VK611_19570 [Acidimicrobiales bacterium]|nr:hypothetical protein [Acidimicrobiales bacterium]
MIVRTEPALVTGLLQALIAVAVSFGLGLSPEQVGAIVALTAAAGAVFVRRQVTPVQAEPAPRPVAGPQPAET